MPGHGGPDPSLLSIRYQVTGLSRYDVNAAFMSLQQHGSGIRAIRFLVSA
jgi:hypothetical protein